MGAASPPVVVPPVVVPPVVVPPVVTSSQNAVTYASTFLAAGVQAMQSLQQGGNPMEVLQFLGICGPAIAAHLARGIQPPVTVMTSGGAELGVSWKRSGDRFEEVTLEGDAVFVYEGKLPDGAVAGR